MSLKKQSRREFLSTSGSMIGSSMLALEMSAILSAANFACQAHKAGAGFEVLTEFEAKELEAIAAQIFPTDDTPGAKEAGVIYFIDRALNTFRSGDKKRVRSGLARFESKVREKQGAEDFSALTCEQQIAALQSIEESDFFETIRYLTIAGLFSNPSYGGNRDMLGWKHIGFDHKPVWQAPFGYYDEQYMKDKNGNAS